MAAGLGPTSGEAWLVFLDRDQKPSQGIHGELAR